MQFTIREATEQDDEALALLFAQAEALHAGAVPRLYRKAESGAAGRRAHDFLRDLLGRTDGALFVADRHGKAIGFVGVTAHQVSDLPFLTPRRYAVIQEIVVEEGCRRLGIGKALMERAHQWAREQGIRQVELNVHEFNQGALAFYAQLGYATAQRRLWRPLP